MSQQGGQRQQPQYDFEGNYARLGEYAQTPQGQQQSAEDTQRNLDFSGQQGLNAGGGYNPDFAQTQFDRQMSLEGPRMQQATERMDNQLRNQGLAPGSQAYDRAMKDMRDQQGEQTGRMSQDAMRLGADEQQRQFGRELQTRQQGVGEIGQQGQFYNQAGQQQFNQQMGAGSQNFQQGMQSAQQQNALRGQQLGEIQGLQGQYAGAQDAQFQREMDQSRYADQQRAQQASEQLAMGGQGFNQQLQSANFQNMLRQQGISEEQLRRGMSINEMNALISGQQVQMPQMPGFNTATQAETPQLMAGATASQQLNQAPWNALMGGAGSALSGTNFFPR